MSSMFKAEFEDTEMFERENNQSINNDSPMNIDNNEYNIEIGERKILE